MANKTFKVTSGVLNAYIADINEGGTYGTPELLCGLVSFSAETGTNETALVQANKVFFTANEIYQFLSALIGLAVGFLISFIYFKRRKKYFEPTIIEKKDDKWGISSLY